MDANEYTFVPLALPLYAWSYVNTGVYRLQYTIVAYAFGKYDNDASRILTKEGRLTYRSSDWIITTTMEPPNRSMAAL